MPLKLGQQCTEHIQSQAQKCFGETTKFDQVIGGVKRCSCLHEHKCMHISGSILLLLILTAVLVIFCRDHLKDVIEWVENLEKWQGVLLFIVMFTIVSFPMAWGYIILNVAAGYLYGFFTGLLVVIVSVFVGICFSFEICRLCLRDFVQKRLESENLLAVVRVVEGRKGFRVIALSRLTPLPFGLQNGLFAITNISVTKCLAASCIGLLPTQAMNAYMGSTLRSVEDVISEHSGGYVLLVFQVVITIGLSVYVIRKARKELNKACRESEVEMMLDKGDIVTTIPNYLDLPLQKNTKANGLVNGHIPSSKPGHRRAQSASAIVTIKELHETCNGDVQIA